MNRKKDGYLLLENVISITIISIILLILYYSLFFTYNLKNKLESKVELQQQSNEIMKYIENVIENSNGIISINSKDFKDNEVISANSIKCRYNDTNLNKKDKEISFKENLNKIFINSLNNSGNSEPGGYEIGDYVEKIYTKTSRDKHFVNIKLVLYKDGETIEKESNINIRNFKGD
ncbi:hypothetical protein [Romboutsia lituseburensis]|uniref:hypothetical protein n=1 Tax=Romboutsia lituseburensis TaxID=1537 RepID=UPI00215A51A8|nr:hypothetical protein [Romboutsia lituseburensis]MCR8745202.1 hypothetical protein [Romboutsia lituseburensis]